MANGTFTDVTEQSGVAKAAKSYGLTAVAADFDDDGWPDIYVACDSTPSLLFRNNHDGTFSEEGMQRGIALSEDGQEQAGMGVGVGDYDLNGQLNIVKTHFQGDMPGLYHNEGKGDFTDVTIRAGVGVETQYICWGTGFCDLDNDGFPDIFMVAGGVYPEVESKFTNIPMAMPRLLYRNLGNGTFEEISSTPDRASPRAIAVADALSAISITMETWISSFSIAMSHHPCSGTMLQGRITGSRSS